MLVGSVTIIAGDDTFTLAAHGLTDGTLVEFRNVTGGAVGLLEDEAEYYVRNATTDDFQVSGSPGGALIDFVLGGAADVYTSGPSYAAVDLRRFDTFTLHPASVDRFGAREGVRPHSTAAVTVSGTTYTVNESLLTVYPRETSTSAPYRVAVESTSGSLNAADGSNPRIDALDVQVQDDDEDGSGQRRARVVYTAGAPASSPSAPAALDNAFRLATITVPAGGSPVPSVTTEGQFSHGPGVLPVRVTAERPAAGLFEGMYIDQRDTDLLYRWTGSAWAPVASKIAYDYVTLLTGDTAVTDWTTYTPTVSGGGSATFSTRTGSYIRTAPKTIEFVAYFVVAIAGSGTDSVQVTTPTSINRTTRWAFSMHADSIPGAGTLRNGMAVVFQGGSGNLIDRLRIENASGVNSDSNMTGADLGAGATVVINGTYREA